GSAKNESRSRRLPGARGAIRRNFRPQERALRLFDPLLRGFAAAALVERFAARARLVVLRLRVAAAFFAASERFSGVRRVVLVLPPFDEADRFCGRPRPPPDFSPPPLSLFTVAEARRFASFAGVPRSSYPSSMCSARRFCLSLYELLSPRGMIDVS